MYFIFVPFLFPISRRFYQKPNHSSGYYGRKEHWRHKMIPMKIVGLHGGQQDATANLPSANCMVATSF